MQHDLLFALTLLSKANLILLLIPMPNVILLLVAIVFANFEFVPVLLKVLDIKLHDTYRIPAVQQHIRIFVLPTLLHFLWSEIRLKWQKIQKFYHVKYKVLNVFSTVTQMLYINKRGGMMSHN